MLTLYSYSDYREYLRDYISTKKEQTSSFSFRYLAQKADINSAPFYSLVIQGKRNLTKQTIVKTVKVLGLSGDEALFFENLVFFNQAKKTGEKDHFFKKMAEIRKAREIRLVADEEFDYFSHWYHVVIRELVTMMPSPINFKKLAATLRPKISELQAEASVKLLEQLKFIVKNEQGDYIQSDPILTTTAGSDLQKLQLIKFQLETLTLLRQTYQNFNEDDRLTSSTLFAVSRESYKHSVDILRSMRKQLLAIAEQEKDADMVYLLSTNLIPLSHKVYRKNND